VAPIPLVAKRRNAVSIGWIFKQPGGPARRAPEPLHTGPGETDDPCLQSLGAINPALMIRIMLRLRRWPTSRPSTPSTPTVGIWQQLNFAASGRLARHFGRLKI
jgi:hypothetical protein